MGDGGTLNALKTAQDKEMLLKYRLLDILGCQLTPVQITENLEGLMEGTRRING